MFRREPEFALQNVRQKDDGKSYMGWICKID